MSSSRGPRSAGKGKASLNKRIPENPRYKHIQSSIDTGASVTKYLKHLEEIKTNYRYRKDEIFKRLKATTFAQLVLQVAEVNLSVDVDTPVPSDGLSSDAPLALPDHIGDYPESPPDTARSTLSSVISGVGELDISGDASFSPPTTPVSDPVTTSCPYLLLDVRYKEEYDQCHIITAKSYPAAMLSRSCNYFTKDILEYQNKPGKIIVLYDEDERSAPNAATTFVQRGVDNVFMLSGGIKVLFKTFPEGMLTGVVPKTCKITPPGSARGRKPLSSSSSTRDRPLSVDSTVSGEYSKMFSVEDLMAIQDKLDEAFLSSSRASSRTSSSASSRSSAVGSRPDSTKHWK